MGNFSFYLHSILSRNYLYSIQVRHLIPLYSLVAYHLYFADFEHLSNVLSDHHNLESSDLYFMGFCGYIVGYILCVYRVSIHIYRVSIHIYSVSIHILFSIYSYPIQYLFIIIQYLFIFLSFFCVLFRGWGVLSLAHHPRNRSDTFALFILFLSLYYLFIFYLKIISMRINQHHVFLLLKICIKSYVV